MIILFTSVLFTVLALQIAFNVFFAENVYINGRQKQMINIYNQLSTNYVAERDYIYKNINKFEDEINLRALVFDKHGNIIYQTLAGDVNEDLIIPYAINKDGKIINNFTSSPQVSMVKSYRNNTETIAVRGSIENIYGDHYVVLESPLSAITEATETLNKFVIFISTILMALGSLIIYYFANRLSKPVLEINDVAKNVANMDFSKKVSDRHTNDELATLAKNINFMSDQLESMIYDLKVANIELKKDNDIRRQIDDMRRDFIANVSHELKTPLSLLQGYSEMLKGDIVGIDKDFYYDVIIDESQHMNELVKRLLNISSLENGLTKLNYEKFDMSELALWIISKNDILARDKNIEIKHNLSKNAFVFADKLFIEQAMTNFLSNAITYGQEKIEIEITEHEDKYMFKIKNDGNSISDGDLEKVWDSFYRTDKSRTRSKDKNFGLGLYIVKTIINAHSGNFGACNEDNQVAFWFEIEKE